MKKLIVILLLALFTVGISSCAEEPLETDPIIPEISQEAINKLQEKKSSTEPMDDRRRKRKPASSGSTLGAD